MLMKDTTIIDREYNTQNNTIDNSTLTATATKPTTPSLLMCYLCNLITHCSALTIENPFYVLEVSEQFI